MTVKEAIHLLESALNGHSVSEYVRRFQQGVWEEDLDPQAAEILADLAYDLEYLEPDELARRESASFIDEKKARAEIVKSLERLKALCYSE